MDIVRIEFRRQKNLRRIVIATAVVALLSPAANAVDLMGIYELAQANDPALRAAEQRLAAAGENPVQARANLWPTLGASAGRTIGSSRTTIAGSRLDPTDTDSEIYGLELRQTIYDDANYGRLDRGRAELSVAEAQFAESWQNFLLRVSERYFAVLTALDSVRFARAEETALRRQFEQAEQRFEVEARRQALISAQSAVEATNAGFEVGTRTIVDVLQSEQRIFQAERDYSQARHQFIFNQLRLSFIAGVLEEEGLIRVNGLLR